MSEHKNNLSNWTNEEKKLYSERRNKGLRGQISAMTVHRAVKDEEGKTQRVVLGTKVSALLSRGKTSGKRADRRRQWMVARRQERKGSTRGN